MSYTKTVCTCGGTETTGGFVHAIGCPNDPEASGYDLPVDKIVHPADARDARIADLERQVRESRTETLAAIGTGSQYAGQVADLQRQLTCSQNALKVAQDVNLQAHHATAEAERERDAAQVEAGELRDELEKRVIKEDEGYINGDPERPVAINVCELCGKAWTVGDPQTHTPDCILSSPRPSGPSEREKRMEKLTGLLQMIEWNKHVEGEACPYCNRAKATGHTEWCEIRAALAQPGGDDPVPQGWEAKVAEELAQPAGSEWDKRQGEGEGNA
jgi:hypothetical protein